MQVNHGGLREIQVPPKAGKGRNNKKRAASAILTALIRQ
jgi:hypothetical protein